MNKLVLATIQSAILLSLLLPVGAAMAAPQAHQASSVFGTKFPISVKVIDSGGNIYELTATGSAQAYTITGQLVSSPYLAYTPWSVYGAGSGASFHLVNTDPQPSNPSYCSWTISATISGDSASGTWTNLGCGGGTGTITLNVCTKATCGTGTSDSSNIKGLPGK